MQLGVRPDVRAAGDSPSFLARLGRAGRNRHLIGGIATRSSAIFIVAAVLTPGPDIASQLLMAAPLLVLYAASVGVAYFAAHARRLPPRPTRVSTSSGGRPLPPRVPARRAKRVGGRGDRVPDPVVAEPVAVEAWRYGDLLARTLGDERCHRGARGVGEVRDDEHDERRARAGRSSATTATVSYDSKTNFT
jgi:hypothetical protein